MMNVPSIGREVARQDRIHPVVRLGIATIEDELNEVLEAWRTEKENENWTRTRTELLHVAGVVTRMLISLEPPAERTR
jgi:hypothetical protein